MDKHKRYRDGHKEELLEKRRKYYQDNKDALREKARIYQQSIPIEVRTERNRKYHAAKPEKRNEYNKNHRSKTLSKFGNPVRCEVCCRSFGDTLPPHWDHDHELSSLSKDIQFRGWLCFNCNTALGHMKDDPDTITKLYEYASRHLLRRNLHKNAL